MRSLVTVLVVVLAPLGAAAAASPQQDLRRARTEFRSGNYEDVIGLLAPLLYPQIRLAAKDDIVDAHVMLGVSYFKKDDTAAAAREFEEALRLDPETELDPLLYSKDVIEFFGEKKQKLSKELARDAEQARLAEENERLKQTLKNSRTIVLEKRKYWVNFIPMGMGQFQNRQRGWGYFFFASEGALAAASLTAFSALAIKYGFPTLQVPADEVDDARRLQVIQVGSGGAFLLFYAIGVIHSVSNYQHQVVVKREIDPSLLDELGLPRPEPETSFHLVPLIGPGTAGVVLSWEF